PSSDRPCSASPTPTRRQPDSSHPPSPTAGFLGGGIRLSAREGDGVSPHGPRNPAVGEEKGVGAGGQWPGETSVGGLAGGDARGHQVPARRGRLLRRPR